MRSILKLPCKGALLGFRRIPTKSALSECLRLRVQSKKELELKDDGNSLLIDPAVRKDLTLRPPGLEAPKSSEKKNLKS
jgi:hypothetical protein